MSDRIQKTFAALKAVRRPALIPYITLGDPDLETSYRAILTLAKAGADLIELGVPFTDPVSDGPVIQKACERALLHPFRMNDIFALSQRVRAAGIDIPLVLMSYANPVFVYGFDAFCRDAVAGGIDAVLLTDIPPEEAGEYRQAALTYGLGTVFLCSPTTSAERLRQIDAASTAYVYYVAHVGVTGTRTDLPPEIERRLKELRQGLSHPLCVGFGISTPAQASSLAAQADGLIIGSAIVTLFEQHRGAALQDQLAAFIQTMTKAIAHAAA